MKTPLKQVLDETGFLSEFGMRALSKVHKLSVTRTRARRALMAS